MFLMMFRPLFPVFVFFAAESSSDAVRYQEAVFAGGCFWCIESAFDGVDGVISALSGYTGGTVKNPSYDEVSTGSTGHYEAVKVVYDPSRVSYEELLDIFWHQIDPADTGGQFADRGSQYQTAIFYCNDQQKRAAEKSRDDLSRSAKFSAPVATKILKADIFYPAEEYHQKYCRRNPDEYSRYRRGSGREAFVLNIWGETKKNAEGQKLFVKPSADEIRKKLSPLQWAVTQENGTEKAFDNEYWNEKRKGVYVDRITGEALFLSSDKYNSGTGWPSFTRPVSDNAVVERQDASLGMARIEVRSRIGDAHLGHRFDDGPAPSGKRYCMNSAALRFIPYEDMEKEGYGSLRKLLDADR